jgi:hypothetical protein
MGQPCVGATRFHLSDCYSHDVAACRWGYGDAEFDESVERRTIAVATFQAKGELVQLHAEGTRSLSGRPRFLSTYRRAPT